MVSEMMRKEETYDWNLAPDTPPLALKQHKSFDDIREISQQNLPLPHLKPPNAKERRSRHRRTNSEILNITEGMFNEFPVDLLDTDAISDTDLEVMKLNTLLKTKSAPEKVEHYLMNIQKDEDLEFAKENFSITYDEYAYVIQPKTPEGKEEDDDSIIIEDDDDDTIVMEDELDTDLDDVNMDICLASASFKDFIINDDDIQDSPLLSESTICSQVLSSIPEEEVILFDKDGKEIVAETTKMHQSTISFDLHLSEPLEEALSIPSPTKSIVDISEYNEENEGFSFKVEEMRFENNIDTNMFKNEASPVEKLTRDTLINEKFEKYITKINTTTKLQNVDLEKKMMVNCKEMLHMPLSADNNKKMVMVVKESPPPSLSINEENEMRHVVHLDKEGIHVDDGNGRNKNESYIGKFLETGISVIGLIKTVPYVLTTLEHLFSIFGIKSNKNVNEEG